MKLVFLFAGVSIIIFSILFIFDFEGNLEKIKLGDLGVLKGQSLRVSSDELNKLLISSGEEWRVFITENVGMRRAHANFGGGGNGILIERVAMEYGCEFILNKKEKVIIIYSK